MKIRYSFLVLVLWLISAISVFAQSNRRVSGSVIDSTKTAVEGANIKIIAGNDTLQTTTNEKGYFSFSKIKF